MLVLFLCAVGCQNRMVSTTTAKGKLPSIQKLVVVGFRSALSEGIQPDVYRDDLTGGVYMAEPVPENVAYHMTTVLFDRLSETGRYDLVTPGKAKGVISTIMDSDPNADLRAPEILSRVGKSLGGDAVLAGYLYRWRERQGTEYGVDRPASVAFSLYLVGSEDGAVLWRGQFDKTQKSVMENVFEWGTFYRTGIKWLSAEELAAIGLGQIINEMPGRTVNKPDEEPKL